MGWWVLAIGLLLQGCSGVYIPPCSERAFHVEESGQESSFAVVAVPQYAGLPCVGYLDGRFLAAEPRFLPSNAKPPYRAVLFLNDGGDLASSCIR